MGKICCVCREKEGVVFDMTYFENGDAVCRDCLSAYISKKASLFKDDFIKSRFDEFLRFWFYDCLTKKRRFDILKREYLLELEVKKSIGDESFLQDREEFCKENDGFYDYVKMRLLSCQ